MFKRFFTSCYPPAPERCGFAIISDMKIIVGNWKMYPETLKEAKAIFSSLRRSVKNIKRAKVIICSPALFLAPLLLLRGTSRISFGGQDAFWENEGAHTGETSPHALASLGATQVILGHSERRAEGETSEIIARKAVATVRNKLTVILCVGEKTRDDAGTYFGEVRDQLRVSLAGFPKGEAKRLIIAYEPIWAIGANALRAATPSDFHEMSILIRKHLVEYFGKKVGFAIPVLYGGSVTDQNAEGFLKDGGADGLLVGRISLDPEKFSTIIHIAERIR